MQVETISSSSQRQIIGGRVYIRQRVSAKGVEPVLWSAWEVWADLPNDELAKNAHDWAIVNGPWNNPYFGVQHG